MRHIMLDLETLSSRPDAAILAIGAVRFDPKLMVLGEEFYREIDGNSATKYGRIDFSTVQWWIQQSVEAQSIFTSLTEKEVLPISLLRFSAFVKSVEDSIIWGNGSTFDNIILQHAFDHCKLTWPVSYKMDYCYRTVRRMFPLDEEDRQGTHHNALDDAKHQARHLMKVLQKINWEVEPK